MREYKSRIMRISVFIILLLSYIYFGCAVESNSQYVYRPPERIEDGLEVGALNEAGIDERLIESAAGRIKEGRYKEVHSMLIVKDNKLVFEEYFPGHRYKWDAPYHHGELVTWHRDMLHNLMSDTKSITSACIGIAIDRGYIQSLSQSIFDYLPCHDHLKIGGKEKITIEHLLTMTSGLEWKEWSAPYSSVQNPCIGIWFQEKDPITFILDRPLVAEPGTCFSYSTGNMVILGEILRNASNMSIDAFSKKYLFEPLQIDTSAWILKYENGVDANNLMLMPRSMAKIGMMFLNNGIWNGRKIISEKWVEKSTQFYLGNIEINVPGENSGKNGYSYSWWIHKISYHGRSIDMYYAGGWGGQHIMVIPELDTVVVFTGGNYVTKRPPFKILKKFILPAII